MKRIGIIGAGRFGSSLVENLAKRGAEILLIDEDRQKVQDFSEYVAKVVAGDATNIRALEDAGIQECDIVVIAIGSGVEGSIMATVNCKELGIGKIIAKANSDIHGKILRRVGADQIVYPNRDCAKRLSKALFFRDSVDLFDISDGLTVAEIDVPKLLHNKTLRKVGLREHYDITVLCVRRLDPSVKDQRNVIIPTPDEVIQPDDKILIFGPHKKIDTFVQDS
ncbi:MAG: TrkA family potassium uptake protein [Kiritimatiellaeota bacterium]|nr:TrkA family potassium uptake protein [Kiritimatiellota bacterium]